MPVNNEILKQIELDAINNNIPIISEETADYLQALIRKKKTENILEIGTAVGYSGAVLLSAAPENCKLCSVELNIHRYQQALENMSLLKLENRVNLILGNALEILPQLAERGEKFDFVFIDGPKGQYPRLFNLADALLNDNGIIVADNVNFHGLLLPEAKVERRKRTMVKRLHEYRKLIFERSEYQSEILNIGDGIAVSYRK